MRKYLILIPLMWMMAEALDKVEIMAENFSARETTIEAEGNVVVHYDNAVIQASTASYDKTNHILTLRGENVAMMGYQGSKIHSDEVKINTQTKELRFKKTFLAENNDIWIFANSAIKKDDNLTFGHTMMSSCDANNSDWKLYADNSHYDGKEHYMTMRNVKVKFWDVPVLYTPYLGFSTHSKRSSGLLFPSFGYSASEGFVYEQPIYWAPSESWDIELNPQIRTDRGEGIYGTLRFADSPYSSGAIRLGYFQDQESYTQEYNLENESHYGFEMLYRSSKLLNRFIDTDKPINDGLFIDFTHLNDIDYIYLQKSPMSHFGMSSYIESKINYFVSTDDFHAGLYAKYFIDTYKTENNATMQVLPTIQLHKYIKPILLDNLTYSLDLTINNYTREEGATVKLAEFYAPLEYTTSFFDDFISLSLKEELYYKQALYGNDTFENDEYDYYNNIHRIKLFSDLTKNYGSFMHVLQPSLTYSLPGDDDKDFEKFEELNDVQKKLYSPGFEEEDISFKLSHYFYDEGGNLKFYQRLSQSYLPEQEEYNWGDLSNEMQYNLEYWKFYNLLVYSHEFNKISGMSSRVQWNGEGFGVSLSHSYERIFSWSDNDEIKTYEKTNDLILNIGFNITKRLNIGAGFTYDLDNDDTEDELQMQYRIGLKYNRDCWNISVGFKQDIRPLITADGTKSMEEDIFAFQLNFVPFGGFNMSSDDNRRY